MYRLALCLLLCLVLAPGPLPCGDEPSDSVQSSAPEEFPLYLKVPDDGSPLPDNATMQRLAEHDPIAFLKYSLLRYYREVKSFQCHFYKQERLNDKLRQPEEIQVWFRDQPHSVKMYWLKGAVSAGKVLYVKGENKDKILIRLAGWLDFVPLVERDPEGADARANGRYPLTEFGIKISTERTLASWVKHKKLGTLTLEYLGTKPIDQLGGRVCHIIHRTGYKMPEDEGVTDLVGYFDRENWMQVGSVMRGPKQLIGEYWFRDLELNPKFEPETFTRQGLR